MTASSVPDPDTSDLTRLAGLKLGNYRLERLIGRGRMGVVYLATDEALLRPTAIKILSWRVAEARGQDPVKWFLAEARIVARINHPRVVQVYGAARAGDLCYLAMEYVPGQSAEALLAAGPLAPELATDCLLQAASALEAAHRAGVIHRDVKPANLLVGGGGLTKLGDFGMALCSAEVGIGNAHLQVGTPYYTAPEIWRGEAASVAADLYALGATYFHLLTGHPPYPGPELRTVELGHLRAAIPDPRDRVPSLPASCSALVARALAKVARDRHPSAEVLRWEARRVLADLSGGAAARAPGGAADDGGGEAGADSSPALAGPLARALQFRRRPFCALPPAWTRGAGPAASLADALGRRLAEDAPVVVVAGGEGSGRSALLRVVAEDLAASRRVLALDAAPGEGERALLQRLCAAAGGADGPDDATVDALVERLAGARRAPLAPVLVLDGVTAAPPAVAKLVAAALWSQGFRLVLAGAPGLAGALARAGVDFHGRAVPEVAIRPLDPAELGPYLQDAMAASRLPDAPAIVVSPEALRLLALRSGGALERVDRIAENMLALAAAEGRRLVTSWHAWTAADQEPWAVAPPVAGWPRRPERWPPPEVLDVLDACRRGAGLPPWPRGAGSAE